MYDVKSPRAEEFIDHQEVLDSLAYADANKNNAALLDRILEKARLRQGLTHREASVLLACEDEARNQEVYRLAEQIKKDFYGNRIVIFAPLYLSNYCVNGCVYCPYHISNRHITRKKLTQEDIRREVIALQDMGHKRLAIESGEDPRMNPLEYILESIKTIYSIEHKNGAIRRVNVKSQPLVEETADSRTPASSYILFQETTTRRVIESCILLAQARLCLHTRPSGPRYAGGIDDVGWGCSSDWNSTATICRSAHARRAS